MVREKDRVRGENEEREIKKGEIRKVMWNLKEGKMAESDE